MCGRAAQTHSAVQAAATIIGASRPAGGTSTLSSGNNNSLALDASSLEQHPPPESSSPSTAATTTAPSSSPAPTTPEKQIDNFNMSPGMDAVVFWFDCTTCTVLSGRKVWGLVPQRGTASAPLPTGMSQHFSNYMFNARSDTLYQRPTFARLATSGKTCLIAVDGFFEWKTQVKGKKQPYFVYRKQTKTPKDASSTHSKTADSRPYLLLAGLWTSVPTGRPDDPVLDTFTILTTDACPSLQWLHTRMPVCIWDDTLAEEWLKQPSTAVHDRLDEAARHTPDDMLQWHAVTPDMSSMKFRTKLAIQALPKMKTVTSFFAAANKSSVPAASTKKEPNDAARRTTSMDNHQKKKRPPTADASASSPPLKKSAKSLSTLPTRSINNNNKNKNDVTKATTTNQSTPKKGTLLHFFSPKATKK